MRKRTRIVAARIINGVVEHELFTSTSKVEKWIGNNIGRTNVHRMYYHRTYQKGKCLGYFTAKHKRFIYINGKRIRYREEFTATTMGYYWIGDN